MGLAAWSKRDLIWLENWVWDLFSKACLLAAELDWLGTPEYHSVRKFLNISASHSGVAGSSLGDVAWEKCVDCQLRLLQAWRQEIVETTLNQRCCRQKPFDLVSCVPFVVASSCTLAPFSSTVGRTCRLEIAVISAACVAIVRRQRLRFAVTRQSMSPPTDAPWPARTATVDSSALATYASMCAFTPATVHISAWSVVDHSHRHTLCWLMVVHTLLSQLYTHVLIVEKRLDQPLVLLSISDSAWTNPRPFIMKSFSQHVCVWMVSKLQTLRQYLFCICLLWYSVDSIQYTVKENWSPTWSLLSEHARDSKRSRKLGCHNFLFLTEHHLFWPVHLLVTETFFHLC